MVGASSVVPSSSQQVQSCDMKAVQHYIVLHPWTVMLCLHGALPVVVYLACGYVARPPPSRHA
jgi:hypothetical protein